jgi:small subunit ribosomal protein S20
VPYFAPVFWRLSLANHASALKRARQNEKRNLRNKARKTKIKNLVKAVEVSVSAKSADEALERLKVAQKAIDKTASKGAMHRRTAARKISRLTKKVHAMKSPATTS